MIEVDLNMTFVDIAGILKRQFKADVTFELEKGDLLPHPPSEI